MTTHVTYPTDGVSVLYSVPFPYLEKAHVFVKFNGVVLESTDYTWPTSGSIQTNTALAAGGDLEIYRDTPADALTIYQGGTTVTTEELSTDSLQALYRAEELESITDRCIKLPPTSELAELTLPEPESSALIGWNYDASALRNFDPNAGSAGDLTLRADLADPTGGAALVALKDTAGNFASATVEAALAELSGRFEVSAEKFGAVGDGVADDSVAIDAAILAAAGGVLRLRPGKTYRLGTHLYGLSTGLRMGSNTTIIAYGATILRGTSDISVMLSNDSDGTIGGYAANTNMRIYGGTWDTNFAVLGTPSIPIGFCHSTDIVIRDAVFPNAAASHHVEINSSARVAIEGCTFIGGAEQADDTMEALQIDGAISAATWGTGPFDNTFCTNVRVHGNTFTGTGCGVGTHSSVSGFYHDNISVIGNLFSGVYFAGVRALNWQMSTIANNRFFGGFHAIRAQAKDTTIVRGLTITGNVMWNIGDTAYGVVGDGHGIYLLGSDTTTQCIKDYTIANNSIYGMNKPKSGSGIKVTTCSVGTVTGNVVEITASGIGIDMFGGGSCVVANNRASNEGAGFKSMSFVSMTAIVVIGNLVNTAYVQGSDRVILRQNQCFTTAGITTGAGNTNTTISENLQNTTFA